MKSPKIGKGYVELDRRYVIRHDDETWAYGVGPWEISYGSLGDRFDPNIHHPHRRRKSKIKKARSK